MLRAWSCSLIGLLLLTAPRADGGPDDLAGKMYWTSGSMIQRANLDGSDVEVVVSGAANTAGGLDIDLRAGKMYWSDIGGHRIRRANLDGSNVEELPFSATGSYAVRLDVVDRKLYWSARRGHFYRVELDGSDLKILFTPRVVPGGHDLDFSTGKIYWATGYGGEIYRARLDGSESELLVSLRDTIPRVRLDSVSGKIYWTTERTVERANLDGTDAEILVTGLEYGIAIELDRPVGKMYWTDTFAGTISRADLDGSNIELLVSLEPYRSNPQDVRVIPETLGIGFDIKPGDCRNELDLRSQGLFSAVLLGRDGFDLADIDVSSVELARSDGNGGVVSLSQGRVDPPLVFEDIAAPSDRDERCDCHEAQEDGILDVSMLFATETVVRVLELDELLPGALVELTARGRLLDGRSFEGSDCVALVSR